MVKCEENNYLEQFKDLKLFYKEYVGEQLLSPIISYDKIETYYAIPIMDLRFQVDQMKNRLFEEYDDNATNTTLYIILINHRENKMISDGIKIISVEVVKQYRLLNDKIRF